MNGVVLTTWLSTHCLRNLETMIIVPDKTVEGIASRILGFVLKQGIKGRKCSVLHLQVIQGLKVLQIEPSPKLQTPELH